MNMNDAIKAVGWKMASETEFTLEIEDPCEYPDHYEAGSFSGRVFRNPNTGLWQIEFEHDERSSPMDSDIEDYETAEGAKAAVERWLLNWEQAAEGNLMAERRRQRELKEGY